MRAVVIGEEKRLEVQEVRDPEPGPDELVLRVTASGICGTDLHLHQLGAVKQGTVLGHEFAGEVMETRGGFKAGERVCALPMLTCGTCERCRSGLGAFCQAAATIGMTTGGAYAEYVVVSPRETVRLPDGVDDERGAMVEPLAVALHAVNGGKPRPGETCLVIGAGPIGLAIALWAKHFGANVIVSERAPGRRALAEQFGATRVVDPTQEDLTEVVAGIAAGGPDIVFEAVGAPSLIQHALEQVKFRGRVVVAGACMTPDTIIPMPAMIKEANVQFVLSYEKDDFQYSVDMLDQERIDPTAMITDRIGLEGVADAFVALGDPDTQCKVLVDPR